MTCRERGHASSWVRPEKRVRIYARDFFTCVYCGWVCPDGLDFLHRHCDRQDDPQRDSEETAVSLELEQVNERIRIGDVELHVERGAVRVMVTERLVDDQGEYTQTATTKIPPALARVLAAALLELAYQAATTEPEAAGGE